MKHYSYRNDIITLLSIKELRRWQKKYKIRSDDAFQASSIFEDKDGSHGRWKKELREWLINRPGGELEWQKLQGLVYGRYMLQAEMYPGVANFLLRCKRLNIKIIRPAFYYSCSF